MEEAKKETGRIKAYRAVLKGVTNGECIYKLRLGSVYRTRISEIRLDMDAKFGMGPHGLGAGWLPRKQLEPLEDNIYYWKLIIPPGADERDPLGLLDLKPEEKVLDNVTERTFNQLKLSF